MDLVKTVDVSPVAVDRCRVTPVMLEEPDPNGLIFWAPLYDSLQDVYGATPTFVRASTATYYDANGVLQTAAINEPRFNHTPSGSKIGYLSEGQDTNLALWSEAADNAIWTKTNVSVIADDGAAPDGTTTADRLTATAANGTFIQDLGTLALADYNYSVWIQRVTGSGDIQITPDGGVSWTTVPVTTTMTRFDIAKNVANPDIGIRIVTSGDAIRVWGNHAQTGLYRTSYVPTTTATVTRAADSLVYTVPVGFADAAGSCAYNFTPIWNGAERPGENDVRPVQVAGTSVFPIILAGSAVVRGFDGTNVAQVAYTAVANQEVQFATTWGAQLTQYVDQNTGSSAYDGTLNASSVRVGQTDARAPYAHFTQLRIYDRELAANELV